MADLPTRAMDRLAGEFGGRMGFYVEDLDSRVAHGYCADERFPTASVCKVCVMVELFRQVAEGARTLDDRHRGGSGSTVGSGGMAERLGGTDAQRTECAVEKGHDDAEQQR